jgi:hypothetical protein
MQEPDLIRWAALARTCSSTLSHNYRGRLNGLALQHHLTLYKPHDAQAILTCK